MKKIGFIALRDMYTVFTDRSLILIMLVTPLVLSTIIALAFSNVSGGGAPIRDIPVALVNLDEGMGETQPGQGVMASGAIIASILMADDGAEDSAGGVSGCEVMVVSDDGDMNTDVASPSLDDLLAITLIEDAEAAREAVRGGEYAVAVIIPPDFSRETTYTQASRRLQASQIEVYGDPARPVSVSIVRSIVEGVANQLMVGQISVASTIEAMISRAESDPVFGLNFVALTAGGTFAPDFGCAFVPDLNPIRLERVQVTAGEEAQPFNLLVVFGSALALFFALFTANGGATNILEESNNGTLQRLLVTPTSRLQIMVGKLIGIFATVLIQLIFLLVSLTLVNTLMTGTFTLIWGDNWLLVGGLLLASALGASGVGMVTAAAANTTEQANVVGSIIAMFMGVTGGAFFQLPPSPVVDVVSSFSIVHWGSEAFTMLSQGQMDVVPHLIILVGIGVLFFGISLIIFNRRRDLGA